MRTKTFVNTKIRAGEKIRNTRMFVKDLEKYIDDIYEKEAGKRKTDKGKRAQRVKKDATLEYFKKTSTKELVAMFDLYNLLIDAKLLIIKKLDKAGGLTTFLKTADGLQVTGQEGFVAIDHMGKTAVKLVDRLDFSNANFNDKYIKGWDK